MSKTVALIALLFSIGLAVYAFRASYRSGDLDRRMILVVALCVVIVGALGYLSVGSDYSPAACGAGPTAYEC